MQHSFDIELAERFGMLEAILLNHLQFWIEKNKANDTNYYDGTYWTYNSTKAFAQLFPYVSQRKIQNALKRLKDAGIIQTGNYNKSAYDRTLWYAFTEYGYSIMQKKEMKEQKKGNELGENVQPIPDNKPDVKPNIKPYNYQLVADMYNETCVSFPRIRQLSDSRKKTIKARLKTYSYADFEELFKKAEASSFLKGSNSHDWSATFDWLIKDANMAKVLDGNYDDVKPIEEVTDTRTQHTDKGLNNELEMLINSMK